ncbi:hypothetical protein NKH18_24895 [Streptomyces sp. M10(2022)]
MEEDHVTGEGGTTSATTSSSTAAGPFTRAERAASAGRCAERTQGFNAHSVGIAALGNYAQGCRCRRR